MRKPTLKILAVAGLLTISHLLAYADSKDKPRHKKNTIEVVNLNILHGFACDPPFPRDGDQCRVRDRIKLLLRHIAEAGCPDLVTLQENVTREFVPRTATLDLAGPLEDTVALIEAGLPTLAEACGFTYEIVFDPEARRQPRPAPCDGSEETSCRGIDEELILTRYPVLTSTSKVLDLYSPLAPFFPRHVLYAQVAHPIGPVDVFTTHLAADVDFGSKECGFKVLPSSRDCPSECVPVSGDPDDTVTVRECQAKQMAAFVEKMHKVPEPAIIAGDFNATPGSRTYTEFTDRGWIDSHLAVGNPECDDPMTGENCTAGRANNNLSDLESVELDQNERIDFIFVVPPGKGSKCLGVIQTSDHPGVTSTGLFAAEPNPFAKACGPAPDPICWPSDHSGNALNLSCEPSADVLGHLRSEAWKAVRRFHIPATRLWPEVMRWAHPWAKQLR